MACPPATAGRFELKTRYEPSGAMVGSMSRHCPENDAGSGFDQCPPARCETMIVPVPSCHRPKKTVLPSAVKAGAMSDPALQLGDEAAQSSSPGKSVATGSVPATAA